MVAGPDGRRYLIPHWTTDPKSAEWAVRDVPRLSRAAMSELHGLVSMILRNPVSPETGDCNETSKTEDTAEEAAARAAGADQPVEGREGGGRLVAASFNQVRAALQASLTLRFTPLGRNRRGVRESGG